MCGHPIVDKEPCKEPSKDSEKLDKLNLIVAQGVKNVGRLPAKVLRYVELMAYNLNEQDKKYFSNVGKNGGPSKEAALKRISRHIKKK